MSAQPQHDQTSGPVPHLVRDGAHLVFYDLYPDGQQVERYDVPVAQLRDTEGADRWLRQLAEKAWLTDRHIRLLTEAIHRLQKSP